MSDTGIRKTQQNFIEDPRLTEEHKSLLFEGFAYAAEKVNKGEVQSA